MTVIYLILAGILISACLNVYALALISMALSMATLGAGLFVGHVFLLGAAWQFTCYLQAGYFMGVLLYGVWRSASFA